MHSFEALADSSSYVSLPPDWCLVSADVMNSTTAIRKGNYKAVNTVGVSVIAATLNVLRPAEIPYIFGGDGALVCIPESSVGTVRTALAATLAMAVESFGLILRAAIIPASYLRSLGHEILVARHQVSTHYVQCALFGGGPEVAESMLKTGSLPEEYLISPDRNASADYTGLECRWREVPSPSGETVAIIIKAARQADPLPLYQEIVRAIGDIYGDADLCRPVTEEKLRMALSSRVLRNELRIKTWKEGLFRRLVQPLALRATVVLGWFLMKFGLRFNDADWGTYKKDLVANTDFRKFDGSIRLVLSGSKSQREGLQKYLLRLREQNEIVFGLHISDSALMTCLVEQRQSVHFHFVDAAGGGYASAARALKESEEEASIEN